MKNKNIDVAFSVVESRRNPYFNMVEKKDEKIKKMKISKNGLLIYTKESKIEKINSLLNQRGIKVKCIIPEMESLEEYYLKETGGKFDVI